MQFICRTWEAKWPKGSRPNLVLGHSHEPRFQPALPTSPVGDGAMNLAEFYYNAASVGRFENLLWGLEIRGEKPCLVSWQRPGGSAKARPERRVYSNRQR